MATWQGPALLCYNDAQFTPRDLHNISRIGQDSKLEKPAAIGRFGLGFNSGVALRGVKPGFKSFDKSETTNLSRESASLKLNLWS